MHDEMQSVLDFWFKELQPEQWFVKDPALDQAIRQRFAGLHAQVAACTCDAWRDVPEGRLAEIIVLDQFSRNMFRDTPQAFQFDALALALAQEAVRAKADQTLSVAQRAFLYMPYMHSESVVIHEQAMLLFGQPGLEYNFEYEKKHKVIIDRFGRYPHRNAILGRTSSPEELAFLEGPDSSF